MKLRIFLLLFVVFSFASGEVYNDRDQDNALQYLIQEVQSLRSRMSVLENIIENQNEIIRNQNIRLTHLEKIPSLESSGVGSVEKTNLVNDDSEANQLFSSQQSNQTVIGLNQKSLHLPLKEPPKEDQRIKRDSTRIRAVQPIAFYAYMSGHLNNPGGHHTLIFDTVKTNQGNGYHPHVGVFIVPKSGTYFFTWTMSLHYSSYHSTELIVNNAANGSIYLATNSGQRDSATGNLIINVNEGDEVFIRTGDTYNTGQILSDAYSRTDFSGFLIE